MAISGSSRLPSISEVIETIAALHEAGKRDRRELHESIKRARETAFLKGEVPVPEAYRKSTRVVRNPMPFVTRQAIVATLTANPPVIHASPSGPGTEAQRISERKEKVTQEILARLERQVQRPVFRMLVDAAVTGGEGWHKLLYVPMHWAEVTKAQRLGQQEDEDRDAFLGRVDERKRRAKLPFHWVDVDPLAVFPFEDEQGFSHVLEVTEHQRPVLMDRLKTETGWKQYAGLERGMGLDSASAGSGGTTSTVRKFELWTRRYVAYRIEDQVKVVPNLMRRVPYYCARGLTSSSLVPEEAAFSVLYPLMQIAPAVDALLTMRTNSAYLNSFPRIFLKRAPNALAPGIDGAQALKEITEQWAEGAALLGQPGEDLDFKVVPQDQTLDGALQLHMQLLEMASPDRILYGQVKGDPSGYALNQRITQARLTLDPVLTNVEDTLTRLVEDLWHDIEHLVKEPIWAYASLDTKGTEHKWLSLGPEDLKGFYSCQVSIEPVLPSTMIAEGQFGASMVAAGLLPKRDVIENHLRRNNPLEVMQEVWVERLMDDPRVQQILIDDAAREAGLIKDMPPQVVPPSGGQPVPLAAATGMPGQFGAPGMPPTPGLGMALDQTAPEGPTDIAGLARAGVGIQPNTQMLPGGLPG